MVATDGVNVNVEPNSDDGMQADVDAHAQHQQQHPMLDPQVMFQQMMQSMMQNFMQQMNNAFAQNGGQIPGGNPAAAGVQTGASVPWQQDKSMGNVRLDILGIQPYRKVH